MTHDSQALLNLFGRLFQQRGFMQAAVFSSRLDGPHTQERGQLRVLRLLATQGELTNADIVDALDIRPSSVSALVSKLEASGLITREPSATDKRVTLIQLTDQGRALIADSRDQKDKLSEALFASLDDSEQQQLAGLLRKLTAGLDAQAPDVDIDDFKRLAHLHGPRHGFDRPGFTPGNWPHF
ncbi:MarR family winged helix-turn-helix transcriptional regulator [Lacticaseibacillus absianus]|uniref:MarR family winged helix-turn-helix transcriptional regulator n=1 Tax=Lacticaseibacillus absianus TaxID=2729623 RepID=UPI0015C8C9A7|nr:MarR family transcriptional regulator [Lacticaseibacillus absianus]